MNTKKILGFRKFVSKTGKPTCIVQVAVPYTDREIEKGACGTKVEEVWIPEQFQHLFNAQAVGKNALIIYEVVGKNAYVYSVEIK